MKIAVGLAVCLCLVVMYVRCAVALPDQCDEDREACLCPNGNTGVCWEQKCENCEPNTVDRQKRALFPFPFRARCRSENDCGSICTCKFKRCCCPWHSC